MTMRFIATNDWHWRSVNPRGRIDNYNEALKAKIKEIFQMADEMKIDAILVAGDIFDSPGVGWGTVYELMDLLSGSPCPICAIAGQHDEWDHDPDSLIRTPFGILEKAGIIIDVAKYPQFFTFGSYKNPKLLKITGRHYSYEADRADWYYDIPEGGFNEKSDMTIMLSHGTVLERSPGFDMKHTLVENIKSRADVICVGDYHPGIGIKKFKNMFGRKGYIINPGSLARLKATTENMERLINVAYFEITEEGVIDSKIIPLDSAKPGNEVLSREHLERMEEKQAMLNEFLGLLFNDNRVKFLNSKQVIETIAKEKGYPDEVVREALERLNRVEEAV